MATRKWALVVTVWLLFSGVSAQAQESKPQPKTPEEELKRREPERQKETPFIAGEIIYEDGTPASAAVRVELVCRGAIMARTIADVKGRFSLVLSSQKSMGWFDASVRYPRADHNPTGGGGIDPSGSTAATPQLAGCEVRVPPQAGVASNSLRLSGTEISGNPFVGVIVLQRLSYRGGTIVSLRSLAAPSKARRAFEKAQKGLQKKKVNHSKVTKELEKAIERYPEYAEAWYLLGQTRHSQNDPEGAREAFRSAIEADDRYVNPYLRLTWLEFSEQRFEEADRLTQRMMELSPERTEVQYLNGLANYCLRRIEAAEKSFRFLESKGYSRTYPLTYFYLGAIDASRGQIKLAAKEFRLYLRTVGESQVPPGRKQQLTKQLALWEKQGLIEEDVETEPSARVQQPKVTADTSNTPR